MNSEGLKIRPLSIRSCKQGAGIYFRVLGFLFTLFMQAFVAHADEMPPQSGVIAMASEPVSVRLLAEQLIQGSPFILMMKLKQAQPPKRKFC